MIKNVDGINIEMTPEEEAAFLASAQIIVPENAPLSVSARQFKLQLLSAGLLDQVDTWIASQPRAVQIAYEYSGSFVRTEPMMAAGFATMGFTEEQIDDFFSAASTL